MTTVDDIISANKTLCSIIMRFESNLKKTNKSKITKGFLDARLKIIKDYWSTFQANHMGIVVRSDQEQLQETLDNLFEEAEESYMNSYTFIHEKFDEQSCARTVTNNADDLNETLGPQMNAVAKSDFNLPRIDLPKFDGSFGNWTPFYDMFRSTVHDNNSIAPVQKLHFLKSCLVAEAAQIIRNLPLTSANYATAWKLLENRYDNKRILVDTQLKILFGQKALGVESAQGIKGLLDTSMECVYALKNIGIKIDDWDVILIFLTVQKMPTDTHMLWEQSLKDSKELPTWIELTNFLESRAQTLAVVGNCKSSKMKSSSNNAFAATVTSNMTCVLCEGNHSIRDCEEFKEMDYDARKEVHKDNALCTNCLAKGHISNKCKSQRRCWICKSRHHTLLHPPKTTNPNNNSNEMATSVETTTSTGQPQNSLIAVNSFHSKGQAATDEVLLATAVVQIQASTGNGLLARALIDQGSQISLITESLANQLKLKRNPVTAVINGIGMSAAHALSETKFTINAHFQTKANVLVHALVLKSLTAFLPSSQLAGGSWDHVQELVLADPKFGEPDKVDILLGAGVYSEIMMDGFRRGAPGTPIAQKTKLGWILSGNVFDSKSSSSITRTSNFHTTSMVGIVAQEFDLRKFWEIEELSPPRRHTKEEEQCERWFEETHTRQEDGRFVVRLPFVKSFNVDKTLGQSRTIAKNRFMQLERKFKNDPECQIKYADVINEYLQMGHMEPVPVNQLQIEPNISCYLPHHAVFKDSSTTTKLRVVFDASAATSSGHSLNECLLVGPRIQQDIFDINLRWRKHRVAINGDIEKMYRQIRIHQNDADYHRILWRNSPHDQLTDYRLLTVTFGTSSAPYLAIKVLQQLAISIQESDPHISTTIINDFYVDDLLTGADNIDDALAMQNKIIGTLQSAGLKLRKWTSNCEALLENVPENDRETKLPLLMTWDNPSIKTLGVYWHPKQDVFHFKICLQPPSETLSKRSILSDIAKVYDPNGWLAPVTIKAKILMQALWLTGIDWDQQVPNEIVGRWLEYRSNLFAIEQIKIPRWIGYTRSTTIELHCFCDASTRAYAAVVYIRVIDDDNQNIVHMMTAKTKVAPIKTISLPRLELCAAVLGANLVSRVTESLQISPSKIFAWTDSMIVLAWLRGHPLMWKTFVANRVVEIHNKVMSSQWRHVPSADNPADCASRGINPNELQHHPIWWHGPNWLSKNEQHWPIESVTSVSIRQDQIDNEKRAATVLMGTLVTPFQSILQNCATLTKVIRATAYVFQFIHKCQKKRNAPNWLTTMELQDAFTFWIKEIQRNEFNVEIQSLISAATIPSKSNIKSLNPFVDANGILRVGGRLKNTELHFNEKHQIILPSRGRLVQLIIDDMHHKTMHGGGQLMLSQIRRRFWVINAKNIIRHQIHKCIICHRYRAKLSTQLMGQLPSYRVQSTTPFDHTGVDYAGPFDIRRNKGRGSVTYKGYIALFVCMTIKAIHLEVVSDLSADGFLAAFQRFASRRGLCSNMYSDCGTNFVGANRQLTANFNKAKIEYEAAEVLAGKGVKWNFNPPGAPHFGGIWEAGVKSVKGHLKKIMGSSCLTYEEFVTLLCQIEAILNSRPLSQMTADPNDYEPLTPGHFLVGRPLLKVPEPSYVDLNVHRLNRWQRIQQISQAFWRRWKDEYIHQLQQRTKWMTAKENIRMNDLVLVKDDRLPPSSWRLGRVIKIKKGEDNLVRIVTLRTQTGELERPIAKLCVLPIENNHIDN